MKPRVVASIKLAIRSARGFIVPTSKENKVIEAMVKKHISALEGEVAHYISITRRKKVEDEILY